MGTPYIGEIRMFGGTFAPLEWAFCNGQLMSIAENPTLFQLIGTTYGGDGQQTYALPDLQGRVPVHQGQGADAPYVIGQRAGEEAVTLNANQIPNHAHALVASSGPGAQPGPGGSLPAASASTALYTGNAPNVALNSAAVGTEGGLPHNNLQPFLCVNFIISLFGVFPSQS